jgi:hypothetical protein
VKTLHIVSTLPYSSRILPVLRSAFACLRQLCSLHIEGKGSDEPTLDLAPVFDMISGVPHLTALRFGVIQATVDCSRPIPVTNLLDLTVVTDVELTSNGFANLIAGVPLLDSLSLPGTMCPRPLPPHSLSAALSTLSHHLTYFSITLEWDYRPSATMFKVLANASLPKLTTLELNFWSNPDSRGPDVTCTLAQGKGMRCLKTLKLGLENTHWRPGAFMREGLQHGAWPQLQVLEVVGHWMDDVKDLEDLCSQKNIRLEWTSSRRWKRSGLARPVP